MNILILTCLFGKSIIDFVMNLAKNLLITVKFILPAT